MMMEIVKNLPARQGQICLRINQDSAKAFSLDVYIVVEEILDSPDETSVMVVSLRDLQRNLHNPQFAPRQVADRTQLYVVADSLEEYISSWNK